MSEETPNPSQPGGPQRGRGRVRGGNSRGNRVRGRGGHQQPQTPDVISQTPATYLQNAGAAESAVGPSIQAQQATTSDARDPSTPRGGRGSRRGRGSGQRSMVVSHRTRPMPGPAPMPNPVPAPPGLSAAAPDFVPGQPVVPVRNLKYASLSISDLSFQHANAK